MKTYGVVALRFLNFGLKGVRDQLQTPAVLLPGNNPGAYWIGPRIPLERRMQKSLWPSREQKY